MCAVGMAADHDLQVILRTFASQVVQKGATELLFHQGEEPHGCYLVKRGKVRLFMEANPGQRVFRRVVGPGCLVGLPATINGRAYSLTSEVVEDAELAYLSRQDIALLIKSDTSAAMKLLDLLSSEVQEVRSEFANLPQTVS